MNPSCGWCVLKGLELGLLNAFKGGFAVETMTLKSFGRPNLRPGRQQSSPCAPIFRVLLLKIATVCLSLVGFIPRAGAQSIQPIYSFTNGPANSYSSLVQAPDGNFYGTTYYGGVYNDGTVFRVTTNGTLTLLFSFAGTNGAYPTAGLSMGADGNLYGTTYNGGTNVFGNGTVFRITTNGVLTTLYIFSPTFDDVVGAVVYSTNTDGANPYGGLTLGPDGNFYGTTQQGGTSGAGTVFQMTTNGTLTTLFDFNGTSGGSPQSALTLGPDGNLYGTAAGGSTPYGTVFRITTNGTLTSLASFDYTNGSEPAGGLTLGPDGNFYGTTYEGGSNGYGSIFQVTTNGTLTSLYSFTVASVMNADGANPYAGLTLGADGNFYGTAYNGGATGNGTLFRITTDGTFTTLHSFNSRASFNDTDGANPYASLTVGSDGNLYGTTYHGGSSDAGAIFQITTNGLLTPLASLGSIDGANPYAGLTLGPAGNFYGTTSGNGGRNGWGTVFTVSTNGSLTTLVSFYTNGAAPYAALTLGPDGNFYGTTWAGGVGFGTVFQVTTNGTLTTLSIFGSPGLTNGATPSAGLTLGPDGAFYGTTVAGGSSGNGTLFRVNTNGSFTTIYSFSATVSSTNMDGAKPYAGLTLGPDGNLYGAALRGGSRGLGTIFMVTTNGSFTTLISFGGTNGANPYAGLTLGDDGKLYGTTTNGGSSGYGTVFQITTDGTLLTLASFDSTNKVRPKAALAFGPDGNLYGTATYVLPIGFPPVAKYGTVFMVTTNGSLTTLAYFGSTNGAYPLAGLTLGTDGNFYGTTFGGGNGGGIGVIYRLNLPPSFITQPSNQTVAVGSNGTFNVTLFGTAPFAYQWLSNGTPITDATNCALTIPDFTPPNVGNYQVIVTNAWGSVTSSVATITLPVLPSITNQPASESVPIGGTANFAVVAGGSPPLAYQWYFNTSTLLPGATNASLCFSPLLANQAGQYEVIVTSPFGSATSSAASLTALMQPNCYGISNSGSGSVTLLLASTPGSTNRIWTSTNLNLPFAQWEVISTNTADATGLLQFNDTNAGDSARFYILSSP